MAKAKTTCRFWHRSDRPNLDGTAPIHLVYQISGQRKYYSIPDLKLHPINWNIKDQKAVYVDQKTAKKKFPGIDTDALLRTSEVKEINEELQRIINKVKCIEDDFVKRGVEFSTSMVIDNLHQNTRFNTKVDIATNAIFKFIDNYIIDNKTIREAGSLTVYKTLGKHLKGFQDTTGLLVNFESIDYSFFTQFQNYLLSLTITLKDGTTIPKLNNTTIAKQLSTLKTIIGYARINGVEVNERYKSFKIKREPLEVIALTNDEFETLYYANLKGNKRLEQVRDVFCFSCATGLRFSDLTNLKRENIKNDELKIRVKKTKDHLTVPITPFSKAILDKYKEDKRPLPVISNQKLNGYIKELCKKFGIDEQIEIVRFHGSKRKSITYPKHELVSVHTGRKTFATLSLEKGLSAEQVMAIGGWKDYKSFKRYVKVTEQLKKKVMLQGWGNLKPSKLKAV